MSLEVPLVAKRHVESTGAVVGRKMQANIYHPRYDVV